MDFKKKEEITREETEKLDNGYSDSGMMDMESYINAYASQFNDSESGGEWRIDSLLQAEEAEGITEDSYIKKKE